MDLATIEKFFWCGKFLGLTPSSSKNKNPTCFQKLYEIAVFTTYVSSMGLSFYYVEPFFISLSSIQFVLIIISYLSVFCINVYMMIINMQFRRARWFKLLEFVETLDENKRTISIYNYIRIVYFMYISAIMFLIYFIASNSDINTLAIYLPGCLETIFQFFYAIIEYVFLKMLQSKYQHQKYMLVQMRKAKNLLNSAQFFAVLQKIKNNILTLKNGVESFNSIFGWPILFNMLNVASRTLVYIDNVVKKRTDVQDFQYGSLLGIAIVIYELVTIFINWVTIVSSIFLCDSVLYEMEEVLLETLKLENVLTNLNQEECEKLQSFSDTALRNGPKFKAARFFCINRSTLFRLLNSITTFLLVMIQF